jgi:signal transduction histidine kinase
LLGVIYLVVAGTIPLIVTDAVLRAMGLGSDFTLTNGLVVLLPLALIALMIAGLAISMAHADRSVVLSVTKRYAATSADGFTNALAASTYLHNTVQSELTGVAMQLKQAAESGDPQLSRAAVQHAQEIMSRSLTQGFIDQRADPAGHIDRVANAWQGICDVDIAIEPQVAVDPRASVAIQVVEELIANAVRHSGATQITAALSKRPDGISITCRINRQWQAGGIEGLGSTWMATISPHGVETRRTDGGTVLQLTVT